MPKRIFVTATLLWSVMFSSLGILAIVLHYPLIAFLMGSMLGSGIATIFGIHHYLRLSRDFQELSAHIDEIRGSLQSLEIKIPMFTDTTHERPTIH